MPRPRKLSPKQVEHAAADRRAGLSWSQLSIKYKCAINTIRTALCEYSDEFLPKGRENRLTLEMQVSNAIAEIDRIKKVLRKRFNVHI